MCGICGTVNFANVKALDRNVVLDMVATLRHRGPDDAGVVDGTAGGAASGGAAGTGGGVILGHTRLSIIDAAGGAQPMASENEHVWLVFSGEIYNHVELREELRARGHRFRSRSDTEVIIASYLQWGTEAVERFNGQWAFALWDRRADTVILSRDPFGIRPLYYAHLGNTLVFASEIKALMCEPRLPRALRPAGLAATYTLWTPPPDETVFEGVHQLPPGSLGFARAGRAGLSIKRYWQPSFDAAAAGPGTPVGRAGGVGPAAEELRAAISDSVRLRFERSDVPVGVYISGGIDSSIVAQTLSETGARYSAFSLGFEDEEFDESEHQDALAAHLGIDVDRVSVSREDVTAAFPDVVYHAEQPVLRTAPAPLKLLARHVRSRDYRVVLTGEGADELFAGYDLFREHLIRRLQAAGASTGNHGSNGDGGHGLYEWQERSPLARQGLARLYWQGGPDDRSPFASHEHRWRQGAQIARFLSPELDTGSPDDVYASVSAAVGRQLPDGFSRWDPVEQAQYLELSLFFPGYLLSAQSDRMMMAHAVEGRFPFLDPRVAEAAFRLDTAAKLSPDDAKIALKRAFGEKLPRSITSRPKQPYRAPDAAAFFAGGTAPEWFRELTRPEAVKAAGIFRPKMVSRLIEKCQAAGGSAMSRSDNQRLVAVVSTMLLHDQFVAHTPGKLGEGAHSNIRILTPRSVHAGA